MDDFFKNKYRTKSSRLTTWDYKSNGRYFVTICLAERVPYFGQIEDSSLVETAIGEYAKKCWQEIPGHYPFVVLDAFVLMPDHLHGVLDICKEDRTQWKTNKFEPQYQNLANVVRGFKMAVTSFAKANHIDFCWQPRYYDRIIWNNRDLESVRNYIRDNPENWKNRYQRRI
jgi:putative transposase